MKKSILTAKLMAAVVLCLVFVGCNKKDCILGEPCGGCRSSEPCDEEYAPDGVTISWTDYNTTTALRKYFYCHPKTIEQHASAHDTLKAKGWVYIGNPNEGDAMMWSVQDFIVRGGDGFFLTDNDNHNGYSKSFGVYFSDREILENFRSHFDDFFPKQLYITGTIGFTNTYQTSCCYLVPEIRIITLDTIP